MEKKIKFLRKQRRKRLFYLYIMFLTFLSVSIILAAVSARMAKERFIISLTLGMIFWVGLIGTISTAVYITYSKYHSVGFQKDSPHPKQFGLICFFQNAPAIICDMLMFLSAIGFTITRIWFEESIFSFVFLSILIFSFGMHCMLNGSNYIYVNNQVRRATEL